MSLKSKVSLPSQNFENLSQRNLLEARGVYVQQTSSFRSSFFLFKILLKCSIFPIHFLSKISFEIVLFLSFKSFTLDPKRIQNHLILLFTSSFSLPFISCFGRKLSDLAVFLVSYLLLSSCLVFSKRNKVKKRFLELLSPLCANIPCTNSNRSLQ